MESIKTMQLNDQTRPVALRRSIKVPKKSSLDQNIDFEAKPKVEVTNQLSNHQNSQQSTKINIDTAHQTQVRAKHIELFISNKRNPASSHDTKGNEQDLCLATLIDEFQSTLNKIDCDTTSCYHFKLLSRRLTQTLFERMDGLKKEIVQAKRTNDYPASNQSDIASVDMENIDRDRLLDEKDKRIKQLERSLSEQKALRCQDASLVEEKAARIKEWVANKLKELENQNKLLREQNRKQKETVEILTNRLATLSPISSPKKSGVDSGSVRYIDQSSPVDTIDVNKSLKERRPHLIKHMQSFSSSSEDENQNLISNRKPKTDHSGQDVTNQRKSLISQDACLRESPVYDSVTVEQIQRNNGCDIKIKLGHEYPINDETSLPPPPPLHQTDKWELQLYSLADHTLTTMLQKSEYSEDGLDDYSFHLDSLESHNPQIDANASRKSASNLKNNLISLVKPTFTTIDGEQVIDAAAFDTDIEEKACAYSVNYQSSNDLSRQSSMQLGKPRKDSGDSCDNLDKAIVPSAFDSPLRSRTGKDRMLRTQSLRRNPNPEKLYDVITADLIKRSYLVKIGAIKNHNRWFVLKNFQLNSYKNESDEISKLNPSIVLKLEPSCCVQQVNQTSDCSYPFKIFTGDKSFQFVAESAQVRDDWIKILTVSINLSNIKPETLTKEHATHEGLVYLTRQGLTKRCHAILIGHILFFLRSLTDPVPLSYLSVNNARIREITDNFDDETNQLSDQNTRRSNLQDCSLAIYPKYSMTLDPIYLTLGGQQETDEWFYFLSNASGIDQSYGTPFEQAISKLMINNSIPARRDGADNLTNDNGLCSRRDYSISILLHSDKPISQPLTTLPNETLRTEAIELFKSLLLFIQVPLEPIAIDYHVSLLQNCLNRFLRHPELRNEFYAQLIKQATFVRQRCGSPKLSTGSSGNSSIDQRSSVNSLSPLSGDFQCMTDGQLLDAIMSDRESNQETHMDFDPSRYGPGRNLTAPSQCEILQIMQILAVSVSLHLPRGRLRWWLVDYLKKFANPGTNIGKYALYTLKAIDRTIVNGTRDNVPSRTEIMSVLLRNPYDHSNPHSLPVNFSDGSYLVVEADGSTTVEEFVSNIRRDINIRESALSDFYLFADDPSGSRDLHILEPHRKILDVVGWWEQSFRKHNSGRYQNTRVIRFIFKKRLILHAEEGETPQERLLIVHQMNQDVVLQKILLGDALTLELGALMAQLSYGDYNNLEDPDIVKRFLQKITATHIPRKSSQLDNESNSPDAQFSKTLVNRWQQLVGKNAQDCIRIYINCVRRLKLCGN